MELLKTLSMKEAKVLTKENFNNWRMDIEYISLYEASGRILAEDILSPINVPDFNRSTVDGYAVKSKSTIGCSEGLPGFFNVVGEVEMGKSTSLRVEDGECCYVPTGGMLPEGSDGVVMVEYTEALDDATICIYKGVAPHENCLLKGEDIKEGEMVLKKGLILRGQDIGVLGGMGFNEIPVFKKLRVGIISTGDEIVGPQDKMKRGQIRDMNTYSLAAALIKDGCQVTATAVVKDQLQLLKTKISEFLQISDMVLVSGGSSMGTRDVTKDAINQLGEPGVFIHGIAVKPGKPTIVGKVHDKAVFGLPGQPVSALVVYNVLVRSFIEAIQGVTSAKPYILGEMTVNIPSADGREHYVMVNIKEEENKKLVYPLHGKSGMLTMMTNSLGYVIIEQNQEGVHKGQPVKVYLF
ncbi:molybdopterin molybdotransferase MoeA [Alkaliphilus serpentinus]|uniref:Molybdopterin molybdenumtransferase n=1 Tax=Alkaliphilus serpentinus TaxID=1482731 RepID=A0A833HMX0_9FIRM|nr:gephyrin-like molybdotransferase Glp [Alkaliphilus serpentinus]KAB3529049.1 molybdopterin molybdotransferase MoeA [Alkaliphilus serpentinus]